VQLRARRVGLAALATRVLDLVAAVRAKSSNAQQTTNRQGCDSSQHLETDDDTQVYIVYEPVTESGVQILFRICKNFKEQV